MTQIIFIFERLKIKRFLRFMIPLGVIVPDFALAIISNIDSSTVPTLKKHTKFIVSNVRNYVNSSPV